MANDNLVKQASNEVPMLSCQGVWKVFGASNSAFQQNGGAEMSDEALAERGFEGEVEVLELALQRCGVAPRRRALERLRPGFGRG